MTTEQGVRINSSKLKISAICHELKKTIPFQMGTTYSELYQVVAREWNKDYKKIRIGKVGYLQLIEKPLPNSKSLTLDNSVSKLWFIQDIEDETEIYDENSVLIFLHFYFHDQSNPFQFLGTRLLRKNAPISCLLEIDLCYDIHRGIAKLIDPSRSPLDLLLSNGCCICFQFDPNRSYVPELPFTFDNMIENDLNQDCDVNPEIPFISSVADLETQTVDLFFQKYS
jgi:hypothetical protein